MKSKNQNLYDAMKAYASLAIQLIEKRARERKAIPGYEEDVWIKQSDNTFVRKRQLVPIWLALVHELKHDLQMLPEYSDLEKELHSVKIITNQFNKLVGTPLIEHRLEANDVINGIVTGVLHKQKGFKLNEKIFECEYAAIEDALYNSTISCEVIAPLSGFTSAVAPIKLAENLKIDRLTDEEIIHFLKLGALVAEPIITTVPLFAVRIKYASPKVIGDIDDKVSKKALEYQTRLEACIEDILHALRIFKAGECSYPAIVHQSDNWFFKGGFSWHLKNRTPKRFIKCSLDKTEAKDFQKFWGELQSDKVKKRKFIDVACKRFGYSNERSKPEDKLVDLMIAAEALFLSDSGDAKYRGELRYRLALRTGLFLKQREVYNHMCNAYDIRSAIVHGGPPKLPKDKSLKEFVKTTEEYLRAALHKAIHLAAQSTLPSNSLANWDDLIFDRGLKIIST